MTKTNQQEGEGVGEDEINLSLLYEITKDIAKAQVKQDDYAIAAYVNQVCDQLKLAYEDITDYVLMRTTDMNVGGGTIQYSIIKKHPQQ